MGGMIFAGLLTGLPYLMVLCSTEASVQSGCGLGPTVLFFFMVLVAFALATTICTRLLARNRPRDWLLDPELVKAAGVIIVLLMLTD